MSKFQVAAWLADFHPIHLDSHRHQTTTSLKKGRRAIEITYIRNNTILEAIARHASVPTCYSSILPARHAEVKTFYLSVSPARPAGVARSLHGTVATYFPSVSHSRHAKVATCYPSVSPARHAMVATCYPGVSLARHAKVGTCYPSRLPASLTLHFDFALS